MAKVIEMAMNRQGFSSDQLRSLLQNLCLTTIVGIPLVFPGVRLITLSDR